jgi:hypothetical protein
MECFDKAVTRKLHQPKLSLFSSESGSFWIESYDSVDLNQLFLEVCSDFPACLQKYLLDTKSTLDKLAGVEPTRCYPDVEEIIADGFARAELKGMEAKDLFLKDGSLGGTIFALHNEGFVSVEWLAAYLVDTNNNYFMSDVRAKKQNGKDRLLQIFSKNDDLEEPTWLQFGEKKNVYLYLSQ